MVQTYSPLEILLTDDCSPDQTFEIICAEAKAYSGPHKIILNRNPSNKGLSASINRAWELTGGDLMVVQAGDDISVPERTVELVRAWRSAPKPVDLVCSMLRNIDINGVPLSSGAGVIQAVAKPMHLNQAIDEEYCVACGCVCAYTRLLYSKSGPLDERLLTEDRVLPFRALLEGGMLFLEKELLQYRIHRDSISGSLEFWNPKLVNRSQRGRMAMNRSVIAQEWVRAFERSGRNDPVLAHKLARLAKYRELDSLGYQSNRIGTVGLMLRAWLAGVSFARLMALGARHALRIRH